MLKMLQPMNDPNVTAHAILDATVRATALASTPDELAQLIEWLDTHIQDCTADELLERDVYAAFKALLAGRQGTRR